MFDRDEMRQLYSARMLLIEVKRLLREENRTEDMYVRCMDHIQRSTDILREVTLNHKMY